jgi:hypothetical protein
MANDQRNIYAAKAISQIPRLLSQLDRNPYSPTYGSFDRSYWHDKSTDFSNADQQLGAHALALLYKYDFPGNPYKGQPKIREWAIAALDFCTRIQHADGSFDEHYPFERGWAGPTAFLVYYGGEAYRLLEDEMASDARERVHKTLRQAAFSIIKGESEEDSLANHHALACLAVLSAHKLLGDAELLKGYDRLWEGFLALHNAQEGWSMEYDGADPGYLSATISFLAKLQELHPDARLKEVLRQSIEFCSYFVYPDGTFAGSVGSRNTFHFYPHGMEMMAKTDDLALAIADRMAKSLEEGKLVPPEIMSDRYIPLRISEYLLASQDFAARRLALPPLPFEKEPFNRYFSRARIYIASRKQHYVVANLGKGGVLKVFSRDKKSVVLNDGGVLGRLTDQTIVTSQWISPSYENQVNGTNWEVKGFLQEPPRQKPFSLLTNLLFRAALAALGWEPSFSHWLKGRIRKILMLNSKPVPIAFKRTFSLEPDKFILTDKIRVVGSKSIGALSIGGEFLVRHVPQSQYFQGEELQCQALRFSADQLRELNENRQLTVRREVNLS